MNNDWLDIAVLEAYLEGKLGAQAMHRVERQALEDPFVAEALEGLKATPRRKQTLSILQKQLHERVKNQPVKRKIWGITTQRLSIAATATVAFIAVSILFIMRETNRRNQLTKQNHKEVMVNLDSNVTIAKQQPKRAIVPTAERPIQQDKIVSAPKAVISENVPREVEEAQLASSVTKTDADVAQAVASSARIAAAAPQKTNEIRAVLENSAKGIGIATKTNEVLIGKVVSKGDGLALPGVTVRLEDSNVSTTTDKNGNFTLVADSSKKRNLVASYIGYKQKIVNMTFLNNRQSPIKSLDSAGLPKKSISEEHLAVNKPLYIALEPDKGSLAEVVVVGYKAPAKKQMSSASQTILMSSASLPLIGWTKWREYLQKNNRIIKTDSIKKEVVLGFHVSNQGAPIYVKVIKSVGKKENAEAIRLLKDGPLWKPVEEEVQVTIDF
ncbi:hypothetical protein ABIB40_003258 [Pedobacter sp. UYP30]|uniref:carboxypeptidase-like regulatory domain-containing protein n=1 Tax=Pedobacter sp. UYP30 TaxID=1756400 RepID=UPI003399CCFA